MNPTDNQTDNKNKPWLWKKGQSGNVLGRPKGKTMKEYARLFLERMTDEERDEFLEGIPKEKIWEMSEGKAPQSIDHTTLGKELPQPILNLNVLPDERNKQNTGDEAEDTSGAGWDISK